VVVLAALGALLGDWTARNLEMRTLVTKIEASEAAMGALQDSVQEIAARYEGKAPLSAEDQAALDQELMAAAAKGRDEIAAAGEGVAGVRWLLWHQQIGAAQEAYLAHNRAWQAYLERASETPSEFGRNQDEVNSTFVTSEAAVRGALPLAPLFDLRDRVDAIYAPVPLPEGSGQAA
jgi:hypothetical protein